jgi:hypothetical protein
VATARTPCVAARGRASGTADGGRRRAGRSSAMRGLQIEPDS